MPKLEVLVSKKASLPLERNLGARASNAGWLIFIDADSIVLPYFIERVENFIEEKHPVLFTTWFRPDSEVTGDALFTLVANLFVEGSIVFHRPIVPGPLAVIKRDVFNLVGGYDESLTFGEDYDLTHRIAARGIAMKILRETLYIFPLRRVRRDGKFRFIFLYAIRVRLQIGDHLLVAKFLYGVRIPYTAVRVLRIRAPARGDIVVFAYPVEDSKDFIKRMIGIPGDRIEVRDKKVFMNGDPVEDPWGFHVDRVTLPGGVERRDNFGPVEVPPGQYFVMGDNRDRSYDSRFWGFVEDARIKGKAFIIYWSWDSENLRPRLGRIGDLIH